MGRYKPEPPTPTPTVTDDIKGIKTKLDIRLKDIIPFIVLGIIFIIVIIIAAFYIFRKPKEEEIKKVEIDYRAEAMKRLRKSEQLLKRGNVKGYYYDIYEIVRYFISKHYKETFEELTTQEIMRKLKNLKVREKKVDELREFMKECDIVKFADYRPRQQEIEEIYKRAEDIIMKTA